MKIVVIGNGMVGQRFLEQLAKRTRASSTSPCSARSRARPTTACSSPASSRARRADDLSLAPTSFFEDTRVDAAPERRACSRSTAEEGRALGALQGGAVRQAGARHRLVSVRAAGRRARPARLLRLPHDRGPRSDHRRRAARSKVGMVIGGGLLGLEAAKALKDLGLETHVVEFAPRLMAVQLDDAAGRLLRRKIEALGAIVHVSKNTKEIVDGNERTATAGVRRRHQPRDRPDRVLGRHPAARRAGARRRASRSASAAASASTRTARRPNPDIYAIGECALWEGRIFGLVAPGYQMAEVAARHLAGETRRAVPRRRHEHQAEADGRRRGLDRRRARQHARTR